MTSGSRWRLRDSLRRSNSQGRLALWTDERTPAGDDQTLHRRLAATAGPTLAVVRPVMHRHARRRHESGEPAHRAAGDPFGDASADGLDLGQFGHLPIMPARPADDGHRYAFRGLLGVHRGPTEPEVFVERAPGETSGPALNRAVRAERSVLWSQRAWRALPGQRLVPTRFVGRVGSLVERPAPTPVAQVPGRFGAASVPGRGPSLEARVPRERWPAGLPPAWFPAGEQVLWLSARPGSLQVPEPRVAKSGSSVAAQVPVGRVGWLGRASAALEPGPVVPAVGPERVRV